MQSWVTLKRERQMLENVFCLEKNILQLRVPVLVSSLVFLAIAMTGSLDAFLFFSCPACGSRGEAS